MTIKDKAEGFMMISKKVESGEYRVYLTDESTQMAVTLFYKNNVTFPLS